MQEALISLKAKNIGATTSKINLSLAPISKIILVKTYRRLIANSFIFHFYI